MLEPKLPYGFTLVELLVVIAIIGILVSLLLPAVQAARESGRRLQCANNLKQLGLGALNHYDVQHHFPSGGWGWNWTGDPNKGFGKSQPGGFFFNVLPFIEEQAIHDMGKGGSDSMRRAQGAAREGIPVTTFICPSRRGVQAYKNLFINWFFSNVDQPSNLCKSDYAGNIGDGSAQGTGAHCDIGGDPENTGSLSGCSGVIFQTSQVEMSDIQDGTTHTLLAAEKHLNPDNYDTGAASDDDQSAYIGVDQDVYRCTGPSFLPRPDTLGVGSTYAFGSGHAGVFQAVFCDGSVHGLAYEIDAVTYQRLGHRNDGQIISSSDY